MAGPGAPAIARATTPFHEKVTGPDPVRATATWALRWSVRLSSDSECSVSAVQWITREHPRVDRVACPWLIRRWIDSAAEFLYVPADRVIDDALRTGATPYDVEGVELGHHGPDCSFDAFVRRYGLDRDPALAYMAKVIRGADTDDKDLTPESRGVEALLEGVRVTHYPDDQAQREASAPILDALYAFCKAKVGADHTG